MWVKTQNGTRILKVNDFEVDVDTIVTNTIDDYIVLGEYEDYDKALKVLKMIYDFINVVEEYKSQGEYKKEIVSGCVQKNRLQSFIFEMPQDQEVK